MEGIISPSILADVSVRVYRSHWWTRLAINTEHLGRPLQALEFAESALADAWVRGGGRLDLQRRILRLGKPPRRWRRPPWANAALWEAPVVEVEAAPIVSGVGQGVGIRNKCVLLCVYIRILFCSILYARRRSALWEAPGCVVQAEAAPVVSGVGQGVGIRNKCAILFLYVELESAFATSAPRISLSRICSEQCLQAFVNSVPIRNVYNIQFALDLPPPCGRTLPCGRRHLSRFKLRRSFRASVRASAFATSAPSMPC